MVLYDTGQKNIPEDGETVKIETVWVRIDNPDVQEIRFDFERDKYYSIEIRDGDSRTIVSKKLMDMALLMKRDSSDSQV